MFTTLVGTIKCTIGPLHTLYSLCIGLHVHSLIAEMLQHRGPTQSVCVADCYFIVNILDLPFASPIAIYR